MKRFNPSVGRPHRRAERVGAAHRSPGQPRGVQPCSPWLRGDSWRGSPCWNRAATNGSVSQHEARRDRVRKTTRISPFRRPSSPS